MEDFIEIIFYVVILALSGIGSLLKNKKKQQKTVVSHKPNEVKQEYKMEGEVAEQSAEAEENELIRMLREAAEAAAAQQREAELLRERELRVQEEEKERQRREAELRAQHEAMQRAEKAKMQAKTQKSENNQEKDGNLAVSDLDLFDVDAARRAFIASEIFNKKYC
jgi:type IV secretory pathway VirB10-like protein